MFLTAIACGDRSTRCTLMVARGDCVKSRVRMRTACPKSCGFCGDKTKSKTSKKKTKKNKGMYLLSNRKIHIDPLL